MMEEFTNQDCTIAIMQVVLGILDERKISVADFTKATGISRSCFSRYTHGERSLQLSTILKFANFLNVPFTQLTKAVEETLSDPKKLSKVRKEIL